MEQSVDSEIIEFIVTYQNESNDAQKLFHQGINY